MQDFSSASNDQLPFFFQQLEELFLFDIEQAYAASCALLARCKQMELSALQLTKMQLLHSKMLWGKGQYHAALYAITQILKKIQNHSLFELKAEAYLWRGQCNLNLKRHVIAVEDFTYAVELALEYSQISIAIESYVNISQIYYFAEQYDASKEILIIGYRLAVLLNDHKQITKSGIFLSNYLNESGDHASALYILNQIESSALQYGDMTWVVEAGVNIASAYAGMNETELAEVYFESMLAISNFNHALWAKSLTLLKYGEFLIYQNRFEEAIACLKIAVEGINQFDYGNVRQQSAKLLLNAYKHIGDFKSALCEIKKYKQFSESLLNNHLLHDLKGSALNLSRLDRSRKKIIKTRQNFEHMLDLISPGESRVRYQQFKLKCLSATCSIEIIHVQLLGLLYVTGLYLQKMNALLREYCLAESTWTKLPNFSYLIIPDQAYVNSAMALSQLVKIIDGFPWRWHGLNPPAVKIQLIPIQSAIELLSPLEEGGQKIELLI
ncbi:hypothetical protein [Deefgea salmonis]|uniref:Uncharacterized protein n=1 Tax=Deefgea salmonis TaxID=2875502 RepID=A0ABS8BIS2_9NEIS|nr:hypothetical protein [Deefgea salmonis]MCB5195620.1 hypothetical protein [Deefgea salmonis]